MGIGTQLKHAWNAFVSTERDLPGSYGDFTSGGGEVYSGRAGRNLGFRIANERSTVGAIYTRIAVDVSGVPIRHVRTDDQERYSEDIRSGLDDCLTVEANIDQGARAFRQDIVQTLIEEGVVAIVPVDTSANPDMTGSFDIKTMRVGRIMMWYPKHVRVSLYNAKNGRREELVLKKTTIAIVENPLYGVMNEPNGTLKRLMHKLTLLDNIDDQVASGKLDILIQLPFVVKSDARKLQAQQRRDALEQQLKGSKYGVGYVDATEKITQLNRPVENNMLTQVEYLQKQLYVELGITPEVMNGTAEEAAMLNYHDRTIKPLLDAVCEAMIRSFLTKTARSQGQTLMYFRDAFKLVPLSQIADIADKLSRNEILVPNEIRQGIGFKPSSEPKADQLNNSNMPGTDPGSLPPGTEPEVDPETGEVVEGTATEIDPGTQEIMDSSFDEIDAELDKALAEFGIDNDEEDPDAA